MLDRKKLTDFLGKIRKIQSLMVQVSTGKASMQYKEREYQELRRDLEKCFSILEMPDPNSFPTLKDFYGYYSLKFATYRERRGFVNNLYGEVENLLVSLLEGKPAKPGIESRRMILTPIFEARNFELEKDLCFVLMPFRPRFDRLHKKIIKPTLENAGFRVLRADDIYTPTPIVEDIWEHINKARFVLADVTGRNPNVFYELGIAHTIGKETVILTQDENDIPFDLRHLRYFKYDDNEVGWETLRTKLEKILSSMA